MSEFYFDFIKKLPQILLLGVVVIPLDQAKDWRVLKFNKIPMHQVGFSDQGLKVEVKSSAGPLIYPFSKILKIKKIEVSAHTNSLLDLKKKWLQGQKSNDDYILRLGFVLPGKKRLNFLQKATSANWVLELNQLGANRKSFKGFDKVIFFNVGQRSEQQGEKRLHPKSKGLFEERTEWVLDKPGPIQLVKELKKPLPALGLWVSIDGDNSQSEFTLRLKKIKLTVVDDSAPHLKISIMTFNVENLFDTKDDSNKNDETFLPITQKKSPSHKKKCRRIKVIKWQNNCLHWDWSEKHLKIKMKRLADVILQVNQGRGPDILALQEVENAQVLDRLNKNYLQKANYKNRVLIEGTDRRGIDVAFLSRYPLIGQPQLHQIPFKNMSHRRRDDTRGILQSDFKLPSGETLTGYVAHFPAPFHPYHYRIQAYKFLNQLAKRLPKDRIYFAAGDFNTPSKEDKKHSILKKYVEHQWLVGHKISCQDCLGTNYYPPTKEWSFLDMIILSKNLAPWAKNEWKLLPSSVTVAHKSIYQRQKNGQPLRFNLPKPKGVSDHWPLYLELVKSSQKK